MQDRPNRIEVQNCGPVDSLDIQLPPGGGLVILRGRNGTGKSHVIEGVRQVLGKSGPRLPVRDGADKAAISGWGMSIKVGQRRSTSGALVVDSIEGKYDLPKLIDPGVEDPTAANAERIRAMLTIARASISIADFEEALGVPLPGVEDVPGDPVATAARVKRYVEGKARELEARIKDLQAKAQGAAKIAGDYDEELAIADESLLAIELEEAIRAEQSLLSLSTQAEAQQKAREAARAKLAELPDPELQRREDEWDQANADLVDLQQELAELQKRVDRQQQVADKAYEAVKAAAELAKQQDAFHEVLEAQTIEPPDVLQLNEAHHMVVLRRQRVEGAALARKAADAAAEAKQWCVQADAITSEASALRRAAGQVTTVLGGAISALGTAIRVNKEGMLVVETERGLETFDELSQGQRVKAAVQLAVHSIGPGGVIGLKQEAYESLDPINRQLLVDELKGSDVTIVTAEASDDEQITVEVK